MKLEQVSVLVIVERLLDERQNVVELTQASIYFPIADSGQLLQAVLFGFECNEIVSPKSDRDQLGVAQHALGPVAQRLKASEVCLLIISDHLFGRLAFHVAGLVRIWFVVQAELLLEASHRCRVEQSVLVHLALEYEAQAVCHTTSELIAGRCFGGSTGDLVAGGRFLLESLAAIDLELLSRTDVGGELSEIFMLLQIENRRMD